jgi:LSU ribosomal protein L9P
MEIILKKDVEGVGFKDDIITVKNGFGRNFLIPNGSAILATSSAKKILTENIKQQFVKNKKIVDDANKVRQKKIKSFR